MKKVFKILNLLSVVAMSCVLICCSGGGSSSDDDDAPAVSTTSTPTTTTPVVTNYLARCEYTDTPGDHLINENLAENGYVLESGRAVPYFENTRVSLKSGTTYWVTAEHGYYLESTNPIVAVVLPAGITCSGIDNAGYWIIR
ncbi:MAG: hypothetical protein IIU30_11365 [Treponema sp.]|nr:hypothetical protein [Treponema sp.]